MPTDWTAVQLGDVLDVRHGFAFKGEYFSAEPGPLVMTPGNFRDEGGFKYKDPEKYYSGPVPEGYVLASGALLVAMTEQKRGLLGSSALVPSTGTFLHNQRLGLIVEHEPSATSRRFLYYLFNTATVRDQIQATANGAKVRHTSPTRLKEVKVNLPPFPTQQKTAAVLAAYDELIENNLRRIEILEEMAQVVYREWFVNFRFPGYEDVALVESDSGLIPAGWELRPFAELADFVNGYAFKPAHLGVEGLPIVKIKELKSGVTSDTPRNRGDDIPEKFHIGQGELLFSWSADFVVQLWPYGPALLNQHLFRVIPVPGVSTDFLVHALRQRLPDFRARAQGTTMRHIKRSALTEVQTVLPPGPLRDAFSSLVRPMHELSRNLVMQSANLRATRDLLLPRLVSGEINVSNLDIDTEWLAS